jgi:hypothetical protein
MARIKKSIFVGLFFLAIIFLPSLSFSAKYTFSLIQTGTHLYTGGSVYSKTIIANQCTGTYTVSNDILSASHYYNSYRYNVTNTITGVVNINTTTFAWPETSSPAVASFVNGCCDPDEVPSIVNGECLPLCDPPTVRSSITGQCESCPDGLIYTVNPDGSTECANQCAALAGLEINVKFVASIGFTENCVNGCIVNVDQSILGLYLAPDGLTYYIGSGVYTDQMCTPGSTPPPDCAALSGACVDKECIYPNQAKSTCTTDPTTGEISSICKCFPPPVVGTPIPVVLTDPAVGTTPEDVPEPITTDPNYAVLDSIAHNVANTIEALNGLNSQNTEIGNNNLTALNNINSNLSTGFNGINDTISTTGQDTQNTISSAASTITDTLKLNSESLSDKLDTITGNFDPLSHEYPSTPFNSSVDIIPENDGGLFAHLSSFIASGIPIISHLKSSGITASGSPVISDTFFGHAFTANFDDFSALYHACGMILVFASTVLAYRIVSGGN